MQRSDLLGRILGTIVFLAGVGILVFVFWVAYSFFNSQSSVVQIAPPGSAPGSATAQLGQSAVKLIARILTLVVMAVVGSLIASKGIQLYFNAGRGNPNGDSP